MNRRYHLIWIYFILFSLSACCPECPPDMPDKSEFKHNPHPQKAYQITYRLHDRSREFKDYDFQVFYSARNCEFTVNRFAGASVSPNLVLDPKLEQIDANTFSTIVYEDAILDEDYHNQGKQCHWEIINFAISFYLDYFNKDQVRYVISNISWDDRDKQESIQYPLYLSPSFKEKIDLSYTDDPRRRVGEFTNRSISEKATVMKQIDYLTVEIKEIGNDNK